MDTHQNIAQLLELASDLPDIAIFDAVFDACKPQTQTQIDGLVKYVGCDGQCTQYRYLTTGIDITLIHNRVGDHGRAIIFHHTRTCVSIVDDILAYWTASHNTDAPVDITNIVWTLTNGVPFGDIDDILHELKTLPQIILQSIARLLLGHKLQPADDIEICNGMKAIHINSAYFRRYCPRYIVDGTITLELSDHCLDVLEQLFDTASSMGDADFNRIFSQIENVSLWPFIGAIAHLGMKIG